jgi:isopenicillin N synthase-like dioxygenase
MGSESVPVIDIVDLDRAATRLAIDDACCDWGFFQISNHGIDEALTTALQEQMRQFFALPLASKQAIQRTAENSWGYYDRELTRHTPDWKQVYDYGPPDGEQLIPQWPAELPRFQAVIQAYYEACDAIALRLLHVLAANLGMPGDSLDTLFRPDHTSFLRLNYYPKCPTPVRPKDVSVASGGYLGVNHHTDAGALTLLLQDRQPGLEILNNGAWKLVEPHTDTLVVNLGDIAQVWSNDRYRAALHRGLANAEAGASACHSSSTRIRRRLRTAPFDGRRAPSAALPPDQLGRIPHPSHGWRLRRLWRLPPDQSLRAMRT